MNMLQLFQQQQTQLLAARRASAERISAQVPAEQPTIKTAFDGLSSFYETLKKDNPTEAERWLLNRIADYTSSGMNAKAKVLRSFNLPVAAANPSLPIVPKDAKDQSELRALVTTITKVNYIKTLIDACIERKVKEVKDKEEKELAEKKKKEEEEKMKKEEEERMKRKREIEEVKRRASELGLTIVAANEDEEDAEEVDLEPPNKRRKNNDNNKTTVISLERKDGVKFKGLRTRKQIVSLFGERSTRVETLESYKKKTGKEACVEIREKEELRSLSHSYPELVDQFNVNDDGVLKLYTKDFYEWCVAKKKQK